jgi:hypothetical protein
VSLIIHLHPVPKLRVVELYLHSPIRLPNVVLTRLSTGAHFTYMLSCYIRSPCRRRRHHRHHNHHLQELGTRGLVHPPLEYKFFQNIVININRRPANRRFDPSTLPHYIKTSKRLSFPGKFTIANSLTYLAMFTSTVTSASYSGTVAMHSYQCSLLFIKFFNHLELN